MKIFVVLDSRLLHKCLSSARCYAFARLGLPTRKDGMKQCRIYSPICIAHSAIVGFRQLQMRNRINWDAAAAAAAAAAVVDRHYNSCRRRDSRDSVDPRQIRAPEASLSDPRPYLSLSPAGYRAASCNTICIAFFGIEPKLIMNSSQSSC